MAIQVTVTAGGDVAGNPFIGRPGPVVNLKVDVSTLTTAEVDPGGYLKPGVPLKADGTIVSGASQTVYGVTIESQRLLGRTDNASLGTDTNDVMLAVATSGTINRDYAEDVLGRAYSANELAALALGGFKITTT